MGNDDRHFATGQFHQAADREDADGLHELLDERFMERGAAPFVQVHQGILRGGGLGVGAGGDQCGEGVGDGRHLAVDADLVALELIGVARAVDAFVVLADALQHLRRQGGAAVEDVQ